jgi:hypothetical protein
MRGVDFDYEYRTLLNFKAKKKDVLVFIEGTYSEPIIFKKI